MRLFNFARDDGAVKPQQQMQSTHKYAEQTAPGRPKPCTGHEKVFDWTELLTRIFFCRVLESVLLVLGQKN